MSTAALISVEDYLRITDKPSREHRDGEVSAKAMPTKLNSAIYWVMKLLPRSRGATLVPEGFSALD